MNVGVACALMMVDRFKRLMSSESGPRLAGMTLIVLVALSVPVTSILSARSSATRQLSSWQGMTEHGLGLVASQIAALPAEDESGFQRVLRSFERGGKWRALRLVDGKRTILASTRVGQIGERCDVAVDVSSVGDGSGGWVVGAADADESTYHFQALIPTSDDKTGWYLDGTAVAELGTGVESVPASVLVFAALLIGCVMVIVRWVGRHYRHMARISESLLGRGDQIEKELELLRLADATDALAVQWNKLVDFAHTLETKSRRSTAERELKEVLSRTRKGELDEVVEVLPDGVVHVVSGSVIAYANGVARRLLALSDDQNARTRLEDVSAEGTGNLVLDVLRAAIDESGAVSNRSEVVEDEVGETHYRVRVLPTGKRGSRGECVVTISDVSQQVRAERSSSDFVSQVTHELRTPLTNIRAYTETLSSGVFDDPQMITECYNVITKETRRLSRLIDDVLSMSQLEVGSMQLAMHDVDMRALLEAAVQDVRGLADEKEIDLQLKLPSKLPTVQGDRDKLAVVMNNLLGNALKYTPAKGSVFVKCQCQGEEMLISVKDTGIGIAPEDHEVVFRKFQRGSNPETSDIEGTGIGLTTAREIARRHGGEIDLMSTLGEGSTFILKLHMAEQAAALPVAAKQE